MFFEYPEKCRFGRKIPKSKFYENVNFNTKHKNKFINQIDKIIWQYKLAPDTLNLDATDAVPEIEVMDIFLKTKEIDQVMLELIDKAIPLPIIFQIHQGDKIKIKAAYKRPSGSSNHKWVLEGYLESNWEADSILRQSIPQALNLGKLYEAILSSLIPANYQTCKKNNNIGDQIDIINKIKLLKKDIDILNTNYKKEKQRNRQYEINQQIKLKQKELDKLSNSGETNG